MGDAQRALPGAGKTYDMKEKRAGKSGVRVTAVSRCKTRGRLEYQIEPVSLLMTIKKHRDLFRQRCFSGD
ncbi:hypothetical protein [Undibacterium squillarum]|uniref:hypothetical protein n=1 Tax=Undibacterium squillarum TaxID=1131567 RepID=UPI001673EDE8|nr:hypothetical protein [Undibacterium squillarum]